MKIDDISLGSIFIEKELYCYYVSFSESLKWIKHKLDNGIMTEEEYLKELLMIKMDDRMCAFDSDGKFMRKSDHLKDWRKDFGAVAYSQIYKDNFADMRVKLKL